jgi:hypothetical protein
MSARLTISTAPMNLTVDIASPADAAKLAKDVWFNRLNFANDRVNAVAVLTVAFAELIARAEKAEAEIVRMRAEFTAAGEKFAALDPTLFGKYSRSK